MRECSNKELVLWTLPTQRGWLANQSTSPGSASAVYLQYEYSDIIEQIYNDTTDIDFVKLFLLEFLS